MKRIWYIVLLLLCMVALALQIVGGLEYAQSVQQAGARPPLPTMIRIATLPAIAAWIWGVLLTVRRAQWKWLIACVVLAHVGVGIYAAAELSQDTDQL